MMAPSNIEELVAACLYVSPDAPAEVLAEAANRLAKKGITLDKLQEMGAFQGQMTIGYAVQAAEKVVSRRAGREGVR